jgi:mono/diheme cytochrome c family protein
MRNREGKQPRIDRRRLREGVVAVLLCAGWATAALADEGAALYKTLCASCHGADGGGDGPAAAALTPPPADLRRSTLSLPQLMTVIDGRRTVRAHGDAAMPVWGKTFEQAMAGSGRAHRDALRQVQILAEHVRALEGKPAAK